ncbi:hypothetical protein CAEBREN_30391 [Caenorhabditis brenneri]|uniref:Uncharacterized protein n=1 Tax=Caenorhabditis brenneri TaxID=135651 RepID=G0NEE0_CAEBE|nr:hypothetical protein CAEBREN_30391 [Caenorhabditis brenneri]
MTITNTFAVIFSTVGVVSSMFTVSMNLYLLIKYRKKKDDMLLFYYKFGIDVLMGITEAVFLTFVIFFTLFHEYLKDYKNFIIYFSLPGSTLGAIRCIVTLVISIDRVVVVFALTLGFSILLCFKLFILNKKSPTDSESENLSRINRLALIESAIIFVFNLLQNFVAGRFFDSPSFSFQKLGPHGSASKITGCAIEACLVFKTLSRKSSAVASETGFKELRNYRK